MPSFSVMGRKQQEIFLEDRLSLRLRKVPLLDFSRSVGSALKMKGSVAILIASDRDLRSMNRWFRGKNTATDVLSFASGIRGHAGDIAISGETAAANAKRLKLSVGEELKILILHGMLHLAGFDHESDGGKMAEREAALRQRFGLPQSLIARAHGTAKTRPPARKARS